MIQEIAPLQLDNRYYPLPPRAEDRLMIFGDKGLYCLAGDALRFPAAGDFPEQMDTMVYLFAIDDTRYYRLLHGDGMKLTEGRWLMGQELRYLLPRQEAFAAVLALQLNTWYLARRFCGSCGAPNRHDPEERAMLCSACGHKEYPSLAPAVIVGVIRGNALLLTKYAGRIRPHWALVAGYAEAGETLEECVAREVHEETGLRVQHITYYKSQPWPFSGSLLVGYFAEVNGDGALRLDNRELSEAVFVERDQIDVAYEGNAMTNEMICAFRKLGPGPLVHEDLLRQQPFVP